MPLNVHNSCNFRHHRPDHYFLHIDDNSSRFFDRNLTNNLHMPEQLTPALPKLQ